LWHFDKRDRKYILFRKYNKENKYGLVVWISAENPKTTKEELIILEKIKKIIDLKKHKKDKNIYSYENKNLSFEEIEIYFEKINNIIEEFNMWKRI
jgi:hypothetical protein